MLLLCPNILVRIYLIVLTVLVLGRANPEWHRAPDNRYNLTMHVVGQTVVGLFTTINSSVSVERNLVLLVCLYARGKMILTRMWANAQHDGRPAEHRWRAVFNAAKFG